MMKKISLLLILSLTTANALACSDIFINKNEYKVEARSMDFAINIGNKLSLGYIGIKNITDPIIDADKIPKDKLINWTNKYGYLGRVAFDTVNILDGMNTEGLSVAVLYNVGAVFPKYSSKDNRKVLSTYDSMNYLLSTAKNTKEAIDLIENVQFVEGALLYKNGIYISDVPFHLSIRDKSGNSAVIEFIEGKTVIFKNAGNTLTNSPAYNLQLEHMQKYKDLVKNDSQLDKFHKTIPNYDEIIKHNSTDKNKLLGLPGDFTSSSRFVRGTVLTDIIPAPKNTNEALFQAQSVLNSIISPPYISSTTIWATLKDLKNNTIYYKDLLYHQGFNNKSGYAMDINNGYIGYNLNDIDFLDYSDIEKINNIHTTNPELIKKIIPMDVLTAGQHD